MIFESVIIDDLPEDPQEAFMIYETRIRAALMDARKIDQKFVDRDGDYNGNYEPERHYVSSIMAFIDECELDLHSDIYDISSATRHDFEIQFGDFYNKINYALKRLAIRKARGQGGLIGTPARIPTGFKDEIGEYLQTIRKIVNQEISDEDKKDKIFKRISDLQLEIDRNRTTFDALMSKSKKLADAIEYAGIKAGPMVDKLERLKSLIWNNSEELPQLSKREDQKLITKQDNNPSDKMDDEIPF